MTLTLAVVVIIILLYISWIFNGLGTMGLHIFPDVYTRLHAATKCTTFGTMFMSFTVIAYSTRLYIIEGEARFLNMAIHTFIALIALLVTNPTGAHAIARAAHKMGIKPAEAVKDDLEGADLQQKKPVMMKKKDTSNEEGDK